MAARAVRPVKKHVVDDDDRLVFERQRQARSLDTRQLGAFADIVPMHRDIDDAGPDRVLPSDSMNAGQPPRDLDSARGNAGEDDRATGQDCAR